MVVTGEAKVEAAVDDEGGSRLRVRVQCAGVGLALGVCMVVVKVHRPGLAQLVWLIAAAVVLMGGEQRTVPRSHRWVKAERIPFH